jgi:hypothetical protein
MAPVPMRSSCRHLQSHTYSSGRVVERCALNWAPAAPCACPDGCERFVARIAELASIVELEGAITVELDLRSMPATVLDLTGAGELLRPVVTPAPAAELVPKR